MLGVLFITFLIVVIPLIINESYKLGYGYITVWDGDSVIEYYGSFFGSVIAIATIVITIIFTRKQQTCWNHFSCKRTKRENR